MATEYLPDSNVLIAALNESSRPLLSRLANLAPQRLHLSSIVLSELLTGAEKSGPRAAERRAVVQELIRSMTLLPFDDSAAEVYARIRASMEAKGLIIGPHDMQIAAQAISRKLTLITDNLREFRRVPTLLAENWLR